MLCVALTPSTEAAAWCQMTTAVGPLGPSGCPATGAPLHWERRCIEYAIDARGSKDLPFPTVSDIVAASFDAWVSVTCSGVPVDFDVRSSGVAAVCRTAEYNTDGPNVNVIAFVTDWEERGFDPAPYAITTTWHNVRTGELLDVDILVNETRGTYGVCPVPEGCTDGTIDLQNVLTHEIGHFFGLAHTQPENAFATMSAINPPGEVSKRILRDDDIEGFCAIYPPGSLPAECDHTPIGGRELDCETGGSPTDGGTVTRLDGGVGAMRDRGGCGCSTAPATTDGTLAVMIIGMAAWLWRRRSRACG